MIIMDITADPIDSENKLVVEIEYVGNQFPNDRYFSLSGDPCTAFLTDIVNCFIGFLAHDSAE